jgi:hypothetical protein
MPNLKIHKLAWAIFLSASMVPLAAQAQTARTNKTSSATPKKVAATEAGTDDSIKDRIEHHLATDASVKKYDIDVKVNNGAVRLDGSVASEAQKAEAARLAEAIGQILYRQNNLVDPLIAQVFQYMLDKRLVDKWNHWLGGIAGQRPQARSQPTDENDCFHRLSKLSAKN